MSVPTDGTAAPQEPEHLDVGADPSAALLDILGFLAPEEGGAAAEEGGSPDAGAAAGDGQQPAAGEGADGGAGSGGAPAAGAGSEPVVPDGTPAAGEPAAGTPAAGEPAAEPRGVVDAESLTEAWGNVANGFETNQLQHLETEALASVQAEYPKYFDALRQHPRTLVGKEVPRADGQEGMERLRDAADAENWQGAIKHQLAAEIRERVSAKQDELKDVFATVHSSIDLFRNNADLVPRTKQFDKELADRFASMASAYELKSNGKLVGYSVPVQPIINQLRTQLAAERAAKPAPAAAAPSAQQQRAAEQPRNQVGQFDAPQAGIPSRAGSSGAGGGNPADGLMDAFFRQNGVRV